MRLTTKVIITFLGLLLLFGLFEYLTLRFIIVPSFAELEMTHAKDNLQRTIYAIKSEIEHLDIQCHDWSAWDDTCKFVDRPGREFIESNLTFNSFKDLKINLLYICNARGKVIWGKIYDSATKEEVKLGLFPSDALPPNHPLLQFDPAGRNLSDTSLTGVISTEMGPMLFTSRPILTSVGGGPMRGAVIMGVFLDLDLVARLADQTRVNMTITGETERTRKLLENPTGFLRSQYPCAISYEDSGRLDMITAYPDISGKTAFIIQATITRDILKRGYTTVQYAFLAIFAAGAVLAVIVTLLMKRLILSPIGDLTTHVLAISRSGDFSSRLAVTRKDEIGALARGFDRMVENIADMKAQLENANNQLKEDIIKRREVETELYEANRQLQELATMDSLTHLSNRRRFDDVLAIEWKRCAREMTPLSMIIFDVDFFKRYNDTYGHQTGDDCLKTIASVIQEDIKRASDLPARYGGEEFAVILPNTEIAGALAIAEAIRSHVHSLAIPHAKSHIDGRVTISAGVSCMIPAVGTFPDMLITWADKALYKAKASGRNLVKSSSLGQHASGKTPVSPGVQG